MVCLVKITVSLVTLVLGFRAISDDDFARVAIAEQWAITPKLDASGTSWLPLPFWITGAAMFVFGRRIEVAQAVAILLGVLSVLLVACASRWLGESSDGVLGAAVLAAVFPWSARLGVATVPELFTAALVLLSTAALAHSTRRRIWGAAALLAASLSRYEAWPVAAAFLVVCAFTACRSRVRSQRLHEIAAGTLASCGCLSWLAWNRYRHGDVLYFVSRVVGFKRALSGAPAGVSPLVAYPALLLREEPEIFVLLLGALALGRGSFGSSSPATVGTPKAELARRYAVPAALVAMQVICLSVAMVGQGAPTHHPERVLLTAMLLAAACAGARVTTMVRHGRVLHLGILGVAVVLTVISVRFRSSREPFVDRHDEVAIGRASSTAMPPGDKVLLEVVDYGWLAVAASLGRPEDVLPDRSVDPRDPKTASSFDSERAFAVRLDQTNARWVVARTGNVVEQALGAPALRRGAWGLWRAVKNAAPSLQPPGR